MALRRGITRVLELTYKAPSTPAGRLQRGAVLVELVLPQILGSERERLEQCTTPQEREFLAGLLRSQLLALEAGD